MQAIYKLNSWLNEVARVPWSDALLTLRARFREDRLGVTASSLTFTTIIALVPLVTMALAIFTAFPVFYKLQDVLQKWLVQSLVPIDIARQVMSYLDQFSEKASKLGMAGFAFFLASAFALIFTIDRTLNSIWRVRVQRPLSHRMVMYWAVLTLSPVLLAASLTLTSYAVSASKGWVSELPGVVTWMVYILQMVLVSSSMAILFRYVPNTYVRWGHAWLGGLWVAVGLELAKKLLTLYLSKVPTYSLVYGAFATVPILLVWIYLAWVIVLLGAALTAYLPSLLAGANRRQLGVGWPMEVALEVLAHLASAKQQSIKGLSASQLCAALPLDNARLETVLRTLQSLDWVGLLQEKQSLEAEARYVLLIQPENTAVKPLVERCLLAGSASTQKIWQVAQWDAMLLQSVLPAILASETDSAKREQA
jgi:membrane protein